MQEPEVGTFLAEGREEEQIGDPANGEDRLSVCLSVN